MLNKQQIKKALLEYLNSGTEHCDDPEKRHKILIINWFGFVGFFITILLGLNAYFEDNGQLAFALLTSSLLFFLSLQYHWLFLKKYRFKTSSNLIQVSLLCLMLYLVYSGGANNTGPLWIFLVPPVMMFFGGLKGGTINTLLFIVCYCIIMFYPDDQLLQAQYTYEFKTRVLYSLITLTFLSGYYEHSRFQSYLHITQLSQKFELQARRDHLTNIPNRRAMMEQLNYEYARVIRNKTDMSILLVDIDFFKQVNDQYGHEYGDKVLVKLAQLFLQTLRQQDMISRWGGEEFLILLPYTHFNDAYEVAEKIRKSIKETKLKFNDIELKITVSIGVGQADIQQSIDAAINQADVNLYQAKDNGRDCVWPKGSTNSVL
ncbi:GGDEF domain-containing protein [Shewanella donghaensis]|uniref:GGDEF domain-containing protein n=1 Tax=Shewanella donghaensis TaxID=238836 RepID=UPI001181E003|nr:GGDEF domain-containing protein [Shewanella donghaensis]